MSAMPTSAAVMFDGMSASTMMTFNTANPGVMLFSQSWMPTNTGHYIGVWFFLFFLAIVWRALVFALLRLDKRWIGKCDSYTVVVKRGIDQVNREKRVQVWRWSVNLPRAVLASVIQAIAYLLYGPSSPVVRPLLTRCRMIAVMTMNVGFFFAVIFGYFFGELAFGRVGGLRVTSDLSSN
jgi:hypothetical protein